MKAKIAFLFLVMLAILAAPRYSYADRRSYVWTYEYMTMPKGMWELEGYVTTEIPDMNKSNLNTVKPQIELEYGVTDRLDISMYQMWKIKNKAQENDGKYDGFKLRARYRIGQKGQFIVDPLLYFEYIRDPDFSKPNVGEFKLVLAKDIGDLNISYNQIAKRNLEREGKTDCEYAGGINYKVASAIKIGIESKGSYNKRKIALGPVLSWSGRKIWLALGVAWGLNKRTDDLQTRMIVGVLF